MTTADCVQTLRGAVGIMRAARKPGCSMEYGVVLEVASAMAALAWEVSPQEAPLICAFASRMVDEMMRCERGAGGSTGEGGAEFYLHMLEGWRAEAALIPNPLFQHWVNQVFDFYPG